MPRPNYKGYESSEIPPDDFSQEGVTEEKVFQQDPWADTPEPDVTPQEAVKEQITELVAQKVSTPVSEQKNEVPVVVEKTKRIKGRSEAQRKSDWRANNRDHYLAKNREYVRAYRARKGQASKGCS